MSNGTSEAVPLLAAADALGVEKLFRRSVLAGLSMDFGILALIRGASHGKAFLKQSGVILRPATKCSYEGPERSGPS